MAFKSRLSQDTEKSVNDFINANLEDTTDNSIPNITQIESTVQKKLDPNAPRNFNSYTLPMNEYEYLLLKALSIAENRPMSNVLRLALLKMAKDSNINI